MKIFIKYTFISISILMLTVLTQIGGIALIIGIIASKYIKFKFNTIAIFICAYLVLTFFLVPIVAPFFGRERVEITDSIKPTSCLTILLNRNYVRPEVNDLLAATAKNLPAAFEIRFLDANFPFINQFPLLPHLSHNDGKKIDISLMYQTKPDILTNLKPSRSGYGVFVEPTDYEFNQTNACKEMGYFQYDFPKFLTLGSINSEIVFSPTHTKKLIQELLNSKNVEKIFVEKHLVSRMKLNDPRIRFQGCQAVRHDDHIHIQVK
jgi:hypothetical protein